MQPVRNETTPNSRQTNPPPCESERTTPANNNNAPNPRNPIAVVSTRLARTRVCRDKTDSVGRGVGSGVSAMTDYLAGSAYTSISCQQFSALKWLPLV